MQKYITKITRTSRRAIRVTIDRENSNMHIQTLTTYSPLMDIPKKTGRSNGGEVGEILNDSCKRQMILRRTDANGKIGREEEAEDEEEEEEGKRPLKTTPYAIL